LLVIRNAPAPYCRKVVNPHFDGRLEGYVRVPGAILSIVGLFWASLQAPFFHFHAEEPDHSTASIPIHLHMHLVRQAPGIAILAESADDDAIETEWSVTQPQPVTILADLAPAGNIWAPPRVLSSAVVP